MLHFKGLIKANLINNNFYQSKADFQKNLFYSKIFKSRRRVSQYLIGIPKIEFNIKLSLAFLNIKVEIK